MIEKRTDKTNRNIEVYYLDGMKVRINKRFKKIIIIILIIINILIIAYLTNRR